MLVAPYTTDADLALDPARLAEAPRLESIMRDAGFALSSGQPGAWAKVVEVDGKPIEVPLDLMVPDALAPEGGRRSARIPPHDKMAARRAVGLEAAVIDNDLLPSRRSRHPIREGSTSGSPGARPSSSRSCTSSGSGWRKGGLTRTRC